MVKKIMGLVVGVIGVVGIVRVSVAGEVAKVDRLLGEHGFVVAANCYPEASLDLGRVKGAGYSMVLWHWSSALGVLGKAPGEMEWGRWAGKEGEMPPRGEEEKYLKTLRVVQLSDEPSIENKEKYEELVGWMKRAKGNPAYADVILSTDLLGISDATMARFIEEAGPDLVMNDFYPWKSEYVAAEGGRPQRAGRAVGGSPTNWYAEMRRFRAHMFGTGTRFGMYRQTFHALQEWDRVAYRDPTESELGLGVFGPMAFNAKMVADFVFNGGASSFFEKGDMKRPTRLYRRLGEVNRAARAIGKVMVGLEPLNEVQPGGEATTDMMFIRGQTKGADGVVRYNAVPAGFRANGGDENAGFTQWTAYSVDAEKGNDPWLRGFGVRNVGPTAERGAVVNEGLRGDAIVAWFRPRGMTKAEARERGEVYMLVVNGLTSERAGSTAGDCRQCVNLDFVGVEGEAVKYLDVRSGGWRGVEFGEGDVPGWGEGGMVVGRRVGGRVRVGVFLEGGEGSLFKLSTRLSIR